MALTFLSFELVLLALSACASATASTPPQVTSQAAQSEMPSGEAAGGETTQSTPPPAAKFGTVRVRIKGFRNQKGQVLTSLFASSKGFPGKGDLAARRDARAIADDQVEVVFDKVAVGSYAVAVLHDEDMNFKMKTGLFGIPKEGFGVSNNATRRFGPPNYSDAKFEVTSQGAVELTISIVYY